MRKILELNGYKVIRTREHFDKARPDGKRKRQFKLQILKDGKSIKSGYYLDLTDRNTAYRGYKEILHSIGGRDD